MYLTYANDAQLDFVPTFYKLAYDQFESRIRIHSATNTRGTYEHGSRQGAATRQSDQRHHRSADAARRARAVQMGHHPLSHRRIRAGRRHEPEGI